MYCLGSACIYILKKCRSLRYKLPYLYPKMEGWINFFSNCLLVLLVVFRSATRVTAKICPLCGTQPVPFPLSTDRTCGDPTYKIRCSPTTSTLFLDAINYSYPITSISPSSQLLTINTSFIESAITTSIQNCLYFALIKNLKFLCFNFFLLSFAGMNHASLQTSTPRVSN